MNNEEAIVNVSVSRPQVTLAMILCGSVFSASAGAVSGATPDDGVPKITVRYSTANLNTDEGARVLYRRLVNAAEAVCPATTVDRPFLTEAVRRCREQALARAVLSIDNPRLAALHGTSAKRS